VYVSELGHLAQHVSNRSDVADVNAPVMQVVRQGLSVHGNGGVVETVADEGGDLGGEEEIGGVSNQGALLLVTLAFVRSVLNAGRKYVRVEPKIETINVKTLGVYVAVQGVAPDVEFSLFQRTYGLCSFFDNIFCRLLDVPFLARCYRICN
jgi:hypothetical protein